MEEESQDEKSFTSSFKPSRHRSPSFNAKEIKLLLSLVQRYKLFVLNKSSTAAASQGKEVAWAKISKIFNSHDLGHTRSADSLRGKWENMKRESRKISKDVINMRSSEMNEFFDLVVSLMRESENVGSIDNPGDIIDDIDVTDLDGDQKNVSNDKASYWDDDETKDNESDEDADDDDDSDCKRRLNRSLNFTPKECSDLLQCVKREKKYVFNKGVTGRALDLKNRAWLRITDSYNKLSPQKRSTKVLRTKFGNMKALARRVGFKEYFKNADSKHEKLVEEIKIEPLDKLDRISGQHDDHYNHSYGTPSDHNFVDTAPDPLSSVLNGDSGIGSTHMGSCSQSENTEIAKLKLELLHYKMETAKLERKKIEESLQEEASSRESRDIERSFRLRAARLEAVAAEMRLPALHEALYYPPAEVKAQQYLIRTRNHL